jgi:putative flippase GtrA
MQKKAVNEIGKFLVVGILSTILNYLVFLILLKSGINYLVSSSIGFMSGVIFGYFLNKRWTYGVSGSSTPRLITAYLSVYLISMLCGLTTIHFLVAGFHVDPAWANIASIFITTAINFSGTKFLVFSK